MTKPPPRPHSHLPLPPPSPSSINWPLTLAAASPLVLALAWASYLYPTSFATSTVVLSLAWILFLITDYRRKTKHPSALTALGLLCHAIPALALYGTCRLADSTGNRADVWCGALLVFRYWRTLAQLFFWFRYAPARPRPGGDDAMKPRDCTVVLPTVGPKGNAVFEDLVASVLVNAPARVVFSTNTRAAAEGVGAFLDAFRPRFEAGKTAYQLRCGLLGSRITSAIQIVDVGLSSKRQQVVAGLRYATTRIVVSADDTAEWTPGWLVEALAAFNDPRVGLVGTRKWVKDLPAPAADSSKSVLHNAWTRWYARFWNNMGGLYLIRHNFEIQSSNAADGGVFCISGRSSLIRAEILTDAFQRAFTNEFVLGCGPVQADDDNFITRWVLRSGWRVKAQCQKEATMTTTLGAYPAGFKFFPSQCQRWSRSTFRQNPIALFVDRDIWWTWPLTVWATYLPWLYNAALVWDALALYAFSQTTVFAEAAHPWMMLLGLFYAIQLTKLVKTAAWWWAHPKDFLLYFVVPAYPLFAYRHSLMKIHTALTCLDMEWTGRTLPPPEKKGE